MQMDLLTAAKELLTPLGYEVLELDISGSGNKRHVFLRIDRLDEAVVSMNDVTLVTEVFGLELDRLDPFEHPYKLDVSSPGPERPLFSRRHFERFHDLRVKVKAGQESFKAIIRQVSDDSVSFECEGEQKLYKLGEVQARLAEWPSEPR